jgi:Ribbon-helix-helix domain
MEGASFGQKPGSASLRDAWKRWHFEMWDDKRLGTYPLIPTGVAMSDLTRWTVKVTKETDIALRSYLAEHGGKKGDLSKFIERAVQKEVLRATIREIQDQNAHRSGEEMQALIDQACAEVRAEFWRDRNW